MIQPISYVKKLEGKSNAHLITFSDGKDYVVKYFQPGFDRSLPNEWVAYCLGRFLGLPIPFATIVEIPEEFSVSIPELAEMHLTQHQFASVYIPGCYDGHQVSTVSSIVNPQTLAGIILFDYWLCNRDRTRKNILLREDTPNSYQLWAIDHAEIFASYNWQHPDSELLPVGILKSATHQLMAQFITDEGQFFKEMEVIQSIPILLIEEIVSLIPDDWNVSKTERKEIVTTLLTRRYKILPKLMNGFIKKVYRPIQSNMNGSRT
ncbi:HipA family kinase [Neobacillus sp. LXY-1]|uniref:HipA family kinase n=1 Tax=Neobacillus sp. LXY-1 TaxID=3379133 RepID=UPI003EE1B478